MYNRTFDWTHILIGIVSFFVIAIFVFILFTAIDSDSGKIVAANETPGVIVDIYKSTTPRQTTYGKTTIYQYDVHYNAKVMIGDEIITTRISEHEYWTYSTGMEVILLSYTIEGGITKTHYTEYAIKVPN